MAQSGLIVRRSVRHEIVLPARVRVAPEHAEEIRFAKGVTDQDGWIDCDLVDFAAGGAGFVCTAFFPRGCVTELQIPASSGDGGARFLCRARVMRVQMTDRRPAYLVGTAFVELDEQQSAAVSGLLDRLDGADD